MYPHDSSVASFQECIQEKKQNKNSIIYYVLLNGFEFNKTIDFIAPECSIFFFLNVYQV